VRTQAESGDHFRSIAPKLGHQPTFDGLRGYFIVAVLFAHFSYTNFASFAAAVDVFFVVSGFLITTLLLEEDRRSGSISMRNFYKRRALRLLPMLYIVIGVTVVSIFAAMAIHGSGSTAGLPDDITYGQLWDITKSDAIAGSLYIFHVVHPVGIEVLEGGFPEIRPLIQLWSLSVEEHYYVFGVLITLFAVHRRLVTQLMVVFLGAYVFISAARLFGHVGPRLAWYQRPDAITLGVVLAFVNAKLTADLSARFRRLLGHAATLAALAFTATVFVGTGFAKPLGIYVPFSPMGGGSLSDGLYWAEFGFTICSFCTAVVVFAMVRTPNHWLRPILSWKPALVVGVRSYAIYLIHVPLFVILVNFVPGNPVVAVLAYLPILVLTTEAGHRFVELPLMKVKKRSATPLR
jgi:peptidoglycan/LPS O-acetylase OafA/YrhL